MKPYSPRFTDFDLSPHSGLTRESWKDAARYLLKGVFYSLESIDSPVVLPRAETEVTYPHRNADPGTLKAQRKAEMFEGLTRSFFIASVLIKEDPELEINGISVWEYYKLHILRSCINDGGEEYAGSYEDMQALTGESDPFRPFQQTVETCALVIGLYMAGEDFFAAYSKEEQDGIAAFLSGYAHANTVPQNWRLFNMLDMAFLNMHGYEIDRNVMLNHALSCLDYHVGDGWYRDGHSFDYYSCWAFNFYAPLWNRWYGYEHMPEIARRFEEISNRLMETYPDMFDEDGFTNMWGRSCIYRNAATSPFDGNLFLEHPSVDCGLARRIASGSLLQFMNRDDFLHDGIPTLGFYGQFTPLVQAYSCAGSPYWLGKAFMCLHLPADHPFWTSTENNGSWEEMSGSDVRETVLEGPALAFTNHKANGQTLLRTAKVVKNKNDDHGMWNYSKLTYNTKYPWESTPMPVKEADALNRSDEMTGDAAAGAADAGVPGMEPTGSSGTRGDQADDIHAGTDGLNVESMQYVLKNPRNGELRKANVTFYAGHRDGVLYRRQFFNYVLENECHWLEAADLADFAIPLGIMRVDRMRIARRPLEITLGAYGVPDNGNTQIRLLTGEEIVIRDERDVSDGSVIGNGDGRATAHGIVDEKSDTGHASGAADREVPRSVTVTPQAYVLKGVDHMGHIKRMAYTVYTGFTELKLVRSRGSNPDSEYSYVPYASGGLYRQYDASEPSVFISITQTLDGDREFEPDEIFPVRGIRLRGALSDADGRAVMASAAQICIDLADGSTRIVDYSGIEGRMSL
ncbi:MAG: DUF2264 domain-containing protein [Lachnospiraceae bacterium]|nr:DUF2264 domain-containing protein [Lachnospiraceae bacterium]